MRKQTRGYKYPRPVARFQFGKQHRHVETAVRHEHRQARKNRHIVIRRIDTFGVGRYLHSRQRVCRGVVRRQDLHCGHILRQTGNVLLIYNKAAAARRNVNTPHRFTMVLYCVVECAV